MIIGDSFGALVVTGAATIRGRACGIVPARGASHPTDWFRMAARPARPDDSTEHR
ncbi:MAG TPA: hypothetical protein VEL07_18690 [Planctomycetota bacterium]|nr:hypothetical protein [Planctomycetota bacterium]